MAVIKNLLEPAEPDEKREMDVIFVHGLDGDVTTTWQSAPGPDGLWPKWLATDLSVKTGIWSVGYPTKAIDPKDVSLQLHQRAINILNLLKVNKIGSHPIVFIVHSLGGLVVKQMLRFARDVDDKGYKAILDKTRGIAFLATPHTGARLASFLRLIPFLHGHNVTDLVYNSPALLELNRWFRDNHVPLCINTAVYSEVRKMWGVRVVDYLSSDPALSNVTPVPLDENHVSICKPASRNSQLYQGIVQFIEETFKNAKAQLGPREAVHLASALYANGRGWQYLKEDRQYRRIWDEYNCLNDAEGKAVKRAFPNASDGLYVPVSTDAYSSDYATVSNLRDRVLSRKHTVLHLSARFDDREFAFDFDRQYSALDLIKHLKASEAKLVVLSKCTSLNLCTRLFNECGVAVVATPDLEDVTYGNWLDRFYGNLTGGSTLRESHQAANAVIGDAWVSLLSATDMRFVQK